MPHVSHVGVMLEDTRPLTHIHAAHIIYRQITGKSPNDVNSNSDENSSRSSSKLHQLYYQEMFKCQRQQAEGDLRRRLSDADIAWQPFRQNLGRLPSVIPQGHRIRNIELAKVLSESDEDAESPRLRLQTVLFPPLALTGLLLFQLLPLHWVM